MRAFLLFSVLVLIAGSSVLASEPDRAGRLASPNDADRRDIEKVLSNYPKAVSTGDEALFLTTILDDQIPFFSVGEKPSQADSLSSIETRDFASFRRSIFHSDKHYRQSFDHIQIRQDASLAQVSLHFVTRVVGSDSGGEGWKTLTLLKVGRQWKIASEFYTVRSLPAPDSEAGQKSH